MNLPNILTLSRIVALFVLVGLLLSPLAYAATIALALFLVAAATDWLDGYLARRYKLVSDFGKLMDALADKVLVLGMFVVLLAMDVLPGWSVLLVLIILGRDFLVTGLRLIAATKGKVMAAERMGKLKTATQLGSLTLLLLSHALVVDFEKPELAATVHEIGLYAFYLATLLTATSGWGYLSRNTDLLFGGEEGE